MNEAAKHIVARVDKVYREKLQERAAEAKRLLSQYREQLEEKVSKIREFSQFEISDFPFGSDVGTVQKVLSLTFNDIASTLWKERSQEGGRILFSVKATLKLLVSPFTFEMFNPTFQIGEERIARISSPGIPVEKEIEKTLYGEATFATKDGTFQLVELKIDKYLADMKDLAQLVSIPSD